VLTLHVAGTASCVPQSLRPGPPHLFESSAASSSHACTQTHTRAQVTLIREYAQGPHALMYCLPTGALDPSRHADLAQCAARELSEEVRAVCVRARVRACVCACVRACVCVCVCVSLFGRCVSASAPPPGMRGHSFCCGGSASSHADTTAVHTPTLAHPATGLAGGRAVALPAAPWARWPA
jgi:ADP-ribose pyrophosphatase YjhB (NUDIX family)